MNEEEQNQSRNSSRLDENQASQSKWKKMLKKKWFFPAVYLTAAALILALIMWYQNPNDYALDGEDFIYDTVEEERADQNREDEENASTLGANEEAVPVAAEQEEMIWPAADEEETEIARGFFDDDASEEEQLEAMVEYDQSYHPHQGINLVKNGGEESFEVLAALSGTVIGADKDPLVGHYVEIEHEHGLTTVYQSLEDVQVSAGDEVSQGDVIARAGRNVIEQDQGIHVHFEIREDGQAVNPQEYLVYAQDDAVVETEEETVEEGTTEEGTTETDAEEESETEMERETESGTESETGENDPSDAEADESDMDTE